MRARIESRAHAALERLKIGVEKASGEMKAARAVERERAQHARGDFGTLFVGTVHPGPLDAPPSAIRQGAKPPMRMRRLHRSRLTAIFTANNRLVSQRERLCPIS